jgi:hypothetical protein
MAELVAEHAADDRADQRAAARGLRRDDALALGALLARHRDRAGHGGGGNDVGVLSGPGGAGGAEQGEGRGGQGGRLQGKVHFRLEPRRVVGTVLFLTRDLGKSSVPYTTHDDRPNDDALTFLCIAHQRSNVHVGPLGSNPGLSTINNPSPTRG